MEQKKEVYRATIGLTSGRTITVNYLEQFKVGKILNSLNLTNLGTGFSIRLLDDKGRIILVNSMNVEFCSKETLTEGMAGFDAPIGVFEVN